MFGQTAFRIKTQRLLFKVENMNIMAVTMDIITIVIVVIIVIITIMVITTVVMVIITIVDIVTATAKEPLRVEKEIDSFHLSKRTEAF